MSWVIEIYGTFIEVLRAIDNLPWHWQLGLLSALLIASGYAIYVYKDNKETSRKWKEYNRKMFSNENEISELNHK